MPNLVTIGQAVPQLWAEDCKNAQKQYNNSHRKEILRHWSIAAQRAFAETCANVTPTCIQNFKTIGQAVQKLETDDYEK